MSWLFEDQADRYTESVREALRRGTAVVPALWPLEVANVLLAAERRGRLTPAEAARFVDLLRALPVEVAEPLTVGDLDALGMLGREHRLSAYDAAYLHLAMRERLPIATCDAALGAAARATGTGLFRSPGR